MNTNTTSIHAEISWNCIKHISFSVPDTEKAKVLETLPHRSKDAFILYIQPWLLMAWYARNQIIISHYNDKFVHNITVEHQKAWLYHPHPEPHPTKPPTHPPTPVYVSLICNDKASPLQISAECHLFSYHVSLRHISSWDNEMLSLQRLMVVSWTEVGSWTGYDMIHC